MTSGKVAPPRIAIGKELKFRRQTHVILSIAIKENNQLVIETEEKSQYHKRVIIENEDE
jgi:hypothetical protein